MLDFFVTWDPLARAGLFGGLFLVSLFAALWVWYDTSGRLSGGAWGWRIVLTALVLACVPAVFIGAANLDADRESLLQWFGWIAIGATFATFIGVCTYIIWGRPEADTAMDDFYAPPTAAVAWPNGDTDAPTVPETREREPERRPAASRNPAEAYFFVKSGPDQGKQFGIHDLAVIGRSGECDVALSDRRVSQQHAQLKRVDGHYTFLDLQATNGSFLMVEGREERLRNAQVLVHGDEVRVGHTVLQFIDARKGGRS